jgi:hypothetical protein
MINDSLSEGSEGVSISVAASANCNVGAGTNVTVTLADNEAAPPSLALTLSSGSPGAYVLSANGAASRVLDIESATTLGNWQPLTTMVNASGTNRLHESVGMNSVLFFRAKQSQW